MMKNRGSVLSYAIIFFSMIIGSCMNNQPDMERMKEQLIAADKKMCEKAQEIGFKQALLLYADDGFVKLNDGAFPVVGKAAFAGSFDPGQAVKTITWEPVYAGVAASGDLGYTWGNWKYKTDTDEVYGNYFSVWKRGKSNEWKLVLDGGNTTPKPE